MKLRSLFFMFLAATALVSPAFADAVVIEPAQVSNAPIWILIAVLVVIVAVALIVMQRSKK